MVDKRTNFVEKGIFICILSPNECNIGHASELYFAGKTQGVCMEHKCFYLYYFCWNVLIKNMFSIWILCSNHNVLYLLAQLKSLLSKKKTRKTRLLYLSCAKSYWTLLWYRSFVYQSYSQPFKSCRHHNQHNVSKI